MEKLILVVLTACVSCGVFSCLCIGQEQDAASVEQTVDADDDDLALSSYAVPPSYLRDADGKVVSTPQDDLEDVGVSFESTGARAWLGKIHGTTYVIIRNTPDQLELVDAYLGGCDLGSGSNQITTIVEFIEVDSRILSDWMFENRLDSDGTPMRRMLQKLVRQQKARVVETSVVVGKSGHRVEAESVRALIYSRETDPSEIPEKVALAQGSEAPATGIVAAAFEYREIGQSLVVEAVLGADGVTVDLSLAPRIIAEDKMTQWPSEEVEAVFRQDMPTFHRVQITTEVVVTDGSYAFLGTANPQESSLEGVEDSVLAIFVRADVGHVADPHIDYLHRVE